ncbi:hypothetical protein Hte_003360 [Hypoxylon texense]
MGVTTSSLRGVFSRISLHRSSNRPHTTTGSADPDQSKSPQSPRTNPSIPARSASTAASSSSSASSSVSDAESESSTVVYEHEPFETFQSRVLDFARQKIWPDAAPNEISVERMAGGGYNRIIGISRQPVEQPELRIQHILRIPRFDNTKLDNQVATLRLLQQRGTIPAPVVISFDQTDDNELGFKYMVQDRLPGVTLQSVYPKLPHKERCRVARELGHAYHELLATSSDAPGALVLPVDGMGPLELLPWERPDVPCTREYSESPVPQDIQKLLVDIFVARKNYDLRRWPTSTANPRLMDKFCNMASELSAGGWFANCRMSLVHLDLEPRNILVDLVPGSEQSIISAIIDWDSAVFAPQFMCCTPPVWLWTWLDEDDDSEDVDERMANEEPPTPEARQLKQLFEESAGPDYLRFAYTPEYRLARQLVRFAIEDIHSNEAFKEAKAMLEEWAAIRASVSTGKDEVNLSAKKDEDNIPCKRGEDSLPRKVEQSYPGGRSPVIVGDR